MKEEVVVYKGVHGSTVVRPSFSSIFLALFAATGEVGHVAFDRSLSE